MKPRTSIYIVPEHRTVAAGEEVVRSFLAAEEAAEDLRAEKNKHRLLNSGPQRYQIDNESTHIVPAAEAAVPDFLVAEEAAEGLTKRTTKVSKRKKRDANTTIG